MKNNQVCSQEIVNNRKERNNSPRNIMKHAFCANCGMRLKQDQRPKVGKVGKVKHCSRCQERINSRMKSRLMRDDHVNLQRESISEASLSPKLDPTENETDNCKKEMDLSTYETPVNQSVRIRKVVTTLKKARPKSCESPKPASHQRTITDFLHRVK